jgi:hypothetical protein
MLSFSHLLFYCIFLLYILFVIHILFSKSFYEHFEVSGTSSKPTLFFIYGKTKDSNQDKLQTIFSKNYDDYSGYLDILEFDVNDSTNKPLISPYKINPFASFEIRFYPNGTSNLDNYSIYQNELTQEAIQEYISNLENSIEDSLHAEKSGANTTLANLSS